MEEVFNLTDEDILDAFEIEEDEDLDYSGIVEDSTRFYLKEISCLKLFQVCLTYLSSLNCPCVK